MNKGWRVAGWLSSLLVLLVLCAPEAEGQRRKGGGKRRKARSAANQGVNAVAKRTANQVSKKKTAAVKPGAGADARSNAAAAKARRPLKEVKRTPIRGNPSSADRLQGKLSAKEGVRYQISGGVVGLDLELVILPDGRAFVRDRGEVTREATFGKKGYSKLQKRLKETGIEDARPQYGDRDASGRRTLKTLILHHGMKTVKVSSYDDPLDPAPDAIRRQFEMFDKLLASPRLKRRQAAAEEFVTVGGVSATVQVNSHVFTLPGKKALNQEPDILEATLALVNAAPDPLQIHFPSEKRFDFTIRDAQNNVMRRWSDGRTFSRVPQTATIAGDNRLLFVGRIPLTDRDGNLLLAGSYSLEYELYTRGSSVSLVSEQAPEVGVPFAKGSLTFRIQPAEEASAAAREARADQQRLKGAGGGKRKRQTGIRAGGAGGRNRQGVNRNRQGANRNRQQQGARRNRQGGNRNRANNLFSG